MINMACKQCNKEFKVWQAWIKKGRKFCSKLCFIAWSKDNALKGKNHPQYKEEAHSRICIKCGIEYEPHNKRSKYCSYRCKGMVFRGANHPAFKKEANYQIVHQWLAYFYGKANKCENYYCPKTSTTYQWALIKGEKSVRDVKNYWQLCRRCHMIYDRHDYPISKTKL